MLKQSLLLLRQISKESLKNYSSRAASITPSQAEITKAEEQSLEILNEFQAHKANNHDFFSYLADTAKEGFTAGQYGNYRDNFFFRTSRTIISAAIHASKAVENHDYKALSNSGRNVADEAGQGNYEGVHLKLLEDSHNLHGKKIYGIPSITIPGSKDSPFLIQEAIDFRKTQEKLFRSSYATMTGCLLAHEDAADQMLINFRNAFFEPYRGYYTQKEFKDLMRYYDAHRDDSKEGGNIEEQHKEQALEIVTNMILNNPRATKLILGGGKKFLDAQSNLWDGMMNAVEKSKFDGQKVPPKYEFLKDSETPSVLIKATTSTKFSEKDKSLEF